MHYEPVQEAAGSGIVQAALAQSDERPLTIHNFLGDDRKTLGSTRVEADVAADWSNRRAIAQPESRRNSGFLFGQRGIDVLCQGSSVYERRACQRLPDGESRLDASLEQKISTERARLEVTVLQA